MPQLRGDEKPLISGKLVIDFASREVTIAGKTAKLTPTEYNLLYHLAKNEGRVMPHRVLLERVWGEEYVDATDYIKKYIQLLREKLGDDPKNPRILLSERGIGYKFIRPE
jgi:two-component system KDP operon response regulator KdpE